MAKLKIKTLQDHIDSLAEELNCIVIQKPGLSGMMYVEEEPPRIEGPTLKDGWRGYGPQAAYMVMLHELGHVAHGHTQGRPPYQDKQFYFDNGVLKSEAQAWEWALDNKVSSITLDSSTRELMWKVCLGSYYSHAVDSKGIPTRLWNGNRHHVKFVFDEPNDFFYSIKERILRGE